MSPLPRLGTRLLMCHPTFFKVSSPVFHPQVSYLINPWMKVERRVDKQRALEQWKNLSRSLKAAGAEILVMEPQGGESWPDLVFTANAAVICGRCAYLASFAYKGVSKETRRDREEGRTRLVPSLVRGQRL